MFVYTEYYGILHFLSKTKNSSLLTFKVKVVSYFLMINVLLETFGALLLSLKTFFEIKHFVVKSIILLFRTANNKKGSLRN